jgi:hypothetical protein
MDNRKEMVSIFYNRTGNLVSATLTWTVLFPSLEKIYKAIDIDMAKKYNEATLWNDLLNYPARRKNNDPSEFDLYDKASLKYDDFSINTGAIDLIAGYEKYIEPYFAHYSDLKNLEKDLNELPLHHHAHIGYSGRQITFGLVLGKTFDAENFNSLVDNYRQYILNDTEKIEFKKKMEQSFENTLRYLKSSDVNKIILS